MAVRISLGGRRLQNAFCILTRGGADGSSWLSHHRSLFSLRHAVFEPELEGSPRGCYICKDNRIFDTDIVGSPLLRRAWVMQERMLATRILHSAVQQIYWECLSMQVFKVHPRGLYQASNIIEKTRSPQDFKLQGRGKVFRL